MGSEMGPLSIPGTTSYRLPIVTIGLSLILFAVLGMFQTDRQTDGRNWSSKRRHFVLKCIGALLCIVPKMHELKMIQLLLITRPKTHTPDSRDGNIMAWWKGDFLLLSVVTSKSDYALREVLYIIPLQDWSNSTQRLELMYVSSERELSPWLMRHNDRTSAGNTIINHCSDLDVCANYSERCMAAFYMRKGAFGGGKTGGLGDGRPSAGSRGRAPMGVWGRSPQKLPQKLKT